MKSIKLGKPRLRIKPDDKQRFKIKPEEESTRSENLAIGTRLKVLSSTKVSEIEYQGQTIRWAKQHDIDSCGPCLCVNFSNFLENLPKDCTPEDVASEVIKKRHKKDVRSSPRRMNNSEFGGWIAKNGYRETQSFSDSNQESEQSKILFNSLEAQDFKAVIFMDGAHYTGAVQHKNELVFLDSMRDQPQEINIERIIEKAKNSLSQGRSVILVKE